MRFLHDPEINFRSRSREIRRLRSNVRRRSMAAHHRLRRTIALLGVAVILFLGAVSMLGGGGGTAIQPLHVASAGFLGKIQTLSGDGIGSLAAMEASAEQAAIDRTLSYTPLVHVAGAQHREVALTFDDGPGPYTPQILTGLEQAHVSATFFVVGVMERYFHESTSRMVSDGFVIGDHTESHAPMSQLSGSDQKAQLLKQARATAKYGASFPRLFRPPYGYFNHTTLKVLHKYRMLMVLWTVDTSDFKLPGVHAIVRTVLANVRPGAIILMHDAGGNRTETVAALPQIIAGLRARGYQMVTVPKLLLDNPPPAHQSFAPLAPGVG